MTDSNRKILAAFLASLMMVSMVGAAVAPAATSAAGPSGMVALGSAQISEDVPAGEDVPMGASDLEGAVYASDHADTLEVVVTTPERASEYLENGTVVSNEEVALVLRDDQVHDGRDVAIDLSILETAVGYTPEVAYGVHDDGEEWQSPIDREGTTGIFHVPEFSSNSVTFSGGITLSGDAAGDGTTYEYELDSLNGVDNYAINLTGVTNTARNNQTGSGVGVDHTRSFSVGGTAEPTDGSGGDPVLSVTGNVGSGQYNPAVDTGDGTTDTEIHFIGDHSDNTGIDSAVKIKPGYTGEIHDITVDIGYVRGSDYNAVVDVYLVKEGIDPDYDEGTLIKDGWEPALTTGEQTFSTDTNVEVSEGETYTLEFDTTNTDSDSEKDIAYLKVDESASTVWYQYDQVGDEPKEAYGDIGISFNNSISELDASTDTGQTVSFGSFSEGETKSKSLDISRDTGELNFSGTGSGTVDYTFSIQEKTETRDPVVEVNGYETSYTGTLADGETTSLATNQAWLQNGTNTVTINTASPSNGPESLVGLEYAHDASGTTQSVEVNATSWTERFNVTNTFPSAVSGADAVLTFNEDVAEIDGVEYRKDGGEWTSPPGYELNGTDLEVSLGDISADTTVDVRATGYKVTTYDGEIDIVAPTVEGDELATEVEIASLLEGGMFGLRVDGTAVGDRIHYASEYSWSGEPAHVDITSTGNQILRAPDANEGSTMTVSSSPISVTPESGAVEVVVEDASEPRFKIRTGDTVGASTVDVTYHDTESGARYVLWSETEGRQIDAARANSPVTFTTDGDTETYTIRQIDREGAVGGGGPEKQSGGSNAPLVLVVPAVGLSVGALFFAGRRFGGFRGARGNAILVAASAVVSVTGLELVTPGSLISQVYRATVFALGDAVASGLGAVLAAIATIVGLWQLQQRTRADVPVWVTIPSVFLAAVLALESIRPGSVLGALEGVIAEVGALLALLAVAGIFWWWRRRNKLEQTEASTPDTQVTLDLGDQGGNE